jgi:diguanylate cyclase (GGDEF)-like protein/PAS domain S-box-containing protein
MEARDKKAWIAAFLRLFLPFALALAAGLAVFYRLDRALVRAQVLANEDKAVQIARGALAAELRQATGDLALMAGSEWLERFLAGGREADRRALTEEMRRLMRQRECFAQIRYLDDIGDERVKVLSDAEGVHVLPPQALQNKSHRYYYEQAITLARGEVYVSPFDLNVERGEVERPFNPTIRFAAPVFDDVGERRGFVIINYRGERLIDRLEVYQELGMGRLMLLNGEGYWLYGGLVPENDWGFMFRRGEPFAERFREPWQRLGRSAAGQFEQQGALFTFAHLDPAAFPGVTRSRREEPWTLVSWVSAPILAAQARDRSVLTALVCVLLLAAWAPVSLHWSRLRLDHAATQRHARRLARVVEQTTDLVLITDPKGIVEYCNPAVEAVTGFAASELIGRTPRVLKSGQQGPEFYRGLWNTLRAGKVFQAVFVNRCKDGALYYEEKTIAPLVDDRGRTTHYVSTGKDITASVMTKAHLDRLSYVAHHDPLTGLANRTLLFDRLHLAMGKAERIERLMAVLFIDLDEFKPVNDRYGHEAGDRLLKDLGQRLRDAVRRTDTVSRLAGDEFAVLLEGQHTVEEARHVARKLLATVTDPFDIHGEPVRVTASIGMAWHPFEDLDAEALINRADAAMYQAKHEGRDRFAEYRADLPQREHAA